MKMNRKGFSLIEIGIVLVVIGLIIAAVMKGKDVIKGAEVKETSQNFMSKWQNVADNYYDKLGFNIYGSAENRMILGAIQTAPTIAFQGDIAPVVCGDDTSVVGTEALPTQNRRDAALQGARTISEELKLAGINAYKVIKSNTNNICRQQVSGEYTEDAQVEVDFGYLQIANPTDGVITNAQMGNGTARRNVIIFKNVPVDVAKAFDKLIDTTVDGRYGKVLSADQTGYVTAIVASTPTPLVTPLVPTSWPTVTTPVGIGILQTVYLVLDH